MKQVIRKLTSNSTNKHQRQSRHPWITPSRPSISSLEPCYPCSLKINTKLTERIEKQQHKIQQLLNGMEQRKHQKTTKNLFMKVESTDSNMNNTFMNTDSSNLCSRNHLRNTATFSTNSTVVF